MRESWDSLTYFANRHAGRLAPAVRPGKFHQAQNDSTDLDAESRGAGAAARQLGSLLMTRKFDLNIDYANRLGSAPVDGRDADEALQEIAAWQKNRQVLSAHGYKNAAGQVFRPDLQPFHIPVLPSGRHLRLDIISTWGDPHYVGLAGIQLFDASGHIIHIHPANISADPSDINILPSYGNDPRTIDKLVDGVNRTCDDLHVWLTPYTSGRHHYIFIDLGASETLAMIRIWNYNKSRIHSYRGARYIETLLDERPIFKGEIQKAPGMLQGAEECAENILFSTDEEILCAIEEHDRHDDNVSPFQASEEAEAAHPAKMERPKTAGSNRADASSQETRGGGRDEVVRASWEYMGKGVDVDGPTERLPPDVVVSERGKVSIEEEVPERTKPAGGEESLGGSGGRPVGLDGRPVTRAGSSATALPPPRVTSHGEALHGRVLTLQLLSNWGDVDAIGLSGIEIRLADRTILNVTQDMVSVSVQGEGADAVAHYLAPSYLHSLFVGEYVAKLKPAMWLVPYQDAVYTIQIDMGQTRALLELVVWNYNSSLEGTYRGVKRMLVSLDDQRASPLVGHLIRKGPGPVGVAYGQALPLQQVADGGGLERVGTPQILYRPSSDVALVQEYEPPTLPCGFIFKLMLLSTWDDRFYMGLNALELYDQFDRLVHIKPENLKGVCVGGAASVADLTDCPGDPRTPDKLVDGVNETSDDRHMWLAPFSRGTPNTLYLIFDHPITLSLIKIWNYQKTPGRGVRELQVCIDDVLVYKGHVRKAAADTSHPGASSQGGQSILFTVDRRVVARERENVYVHYQAAESRDELVLIDSAMAGDPDNAGGDNAPPTAMRPGTSVHPHRAAAEDLFTLKSR